MKILALDTASKSLSVAVSQDNQILDEVFINTGLTHSENLMPAVKSILERIKLSISEIDLFAVTSGPGSFTGLRIGISTINSFCYALGKVCIGIPTLDVLAEREASFLGTIVPILNARRGEVYSAIYKSDGKRLLRLSEYQAIPLTHLCEQLGENEKVLFIGEGVFDYDLTLKTYFKENLYLPSASNYHVSAATLAKLAYERKSESSNQAMPIYLRESEALVRWKIEHPGEAIDGL